MSGSRLPPSGNKGELFRVLGWQETPQQYEELYQKMMREAMAARQRLQQDRTSLSPQRSSDARVQPPYHWADITETALHREILNLARNGSEETRRVYAEGTYFSGGIEENWVVRWFLRQAFRLRPPTTTTTTDEAVAQVQSEQGTQSSGQSQASAGNTDSAGPPRRREYYDPARDV